ncbi:MAG TPA: helix-turn-helix domain-containing protein [Candidatus Bathyarchaeia archaeon]|nr:helix-turn-helix domain-containing protein [Candidatus Bathyarchaeia archaeon]
MIIPCEVAAKSVIPALRAMVARQLIEQYGMKQELVAAKLGVTQAAISKYQHQVRGEAVELEMATEVQAMSRDIASVLSQSSDPLAMSQKFAQACTDIRALGLMCETCSRVDPSWDVEHCTICFGHHSCAETISIDSSSMAKYRKIPIRS